MNASINLPVPLYAGNVLTSSGPVSFSRTLLHVVSESVNQLVSQLVARTVFTKRITKTRCNLGAVSRNTEYYKTIKIVCHVTTVNRLVII